MYNEKNEKNDCIKTYCLIKMLRSMNNIMNGIWYAYTKEEKNDENAENVLLWEFKEDGSLMITCNDGEIRFLKYDVNDGELIVRREDKIDIFSIEQIGKYEVILRKRAIPCETVRLRKAFKEK